MASACVNNIGVPPDTFLDCPPYGWLSPRVSFESKLPKSSASKSQDLDSSPAKDAGDFEFRLDDPVTMLPADELFSDGKLVPLQLSVKPPLTTTSPAVDEVLSPETTKSCRQIDGTDPYLFSPKAPRCSSRWRELLGLKKKQENTNTNTKTTSLSSSSSSSSKTSAKSVRLFLQRNTKTTSSSNNDPTLSLPLLKDTEISSSSCESLSISSSRLSLSSTSSSGHDHDELPRLSLDGEKPARTRIRLRPATSSTRVGRSPMRRAHQESTTVTRGVSVDSPRMNPSGKVVFQSLERSSSSPSSFNGGRPRYAHNRAMERSYSANVVRVTPVLHVPVCSLRGSSKFGFGQLFSSSVSQKKENGASSNSTRHHHLNHHSQQQLQQQQSSCRNKKECSSSGKPQKDKESPPF